MRVEPVFPDYNYSSSISAEVTLPLPDAISIPSRNVLDIPLSNTASCLLALPKRHQPDTLHTITLQGWHTSPHHGVLRHFRRSQNYTAQRRRHLIHPSFTYPITSLRDPAVAQYNSDRRSAVNIHMRMFALQQTFDMDSLLHVLHTSLIQEKRTYWFAKTLSSVCVIVIVGILCLAFYLRSCNAPCAVSKPNTKSDATTCSL
jgi:hypothetical protein